MSGAISGGTSIGKTVFPTDTPTTIAAHFAYFINTKFVGVWASASGATLTITTRSTFAQWLYTFITQTGSAAGTITVSHGTVQVVAGLTFTTSPDLQTGAVEGTWTIDPGANPVFSRAFRDWHADYFQARHIHIRLGAPPA